LEEAEPLQVLLHPEEDLQLCYVILLQVEAEQVLHHLLLLQGDPDQAVLKEQLQEQVTLPQQLLLREIVVELVIRVLENTVAVAEVMLALELLVVIQLPQRVDLVVLEQI
jgi:hypothetical protein